MISITVMDAQVGESESQLRATWPAAAIGGCWCTAQVRGVLGLAGVHTACC